MIRTIFTSAFFLICLAGASGQYTNYYTVKFPDDYTVYGCGATTDTIWPVITMTGNCNFNVGISVKDQKFTTNSTGGCYKILRTWKLLYWCDYDPNWPGPYFINNPSSTDVGPTIVGNSYNHGYLQYTQIIKVVDTDPPTFLDCPIQTVTFCDLTGNDPNQYHSGWTDYCEGPVNLNVKVKDACSGTDIMLSYRLFLDLDNNGSMETYISSSSPNAWPIEKTISGDTVSAHIAFPQGFGLPYGTHKVEWIANDNCGNETLCKYSFIVKDCKPPTIVCLNGLSVNIMQTGMITIWDTDFLQYTEDNCTPTNQIKFGIRKQGAGTGFPQNSHSVTFDCTELGKQYVEVWVEDAYGNADFCLTYVIVQDNIGACPPSTPFKGTISNYQAKAVPGVQVNITKFGQAVASAETDDLGQYQFGSITAGCNYLLAPVSDNSQPKAGVNTLDALLIAAQIDDIQSLPTPYQLLAADVNKSGSLTDDDVNGLVKLVLGTQTDFPGNNSWQFVPGSHTFADPLNPWSASVPSSLLLCLSGNINFNPDFVAIKTGDVDASATSSALAPTIDDRTDQKNVALFYTTEQYFKPGDEVRAEIITPDLGNIAAFQFTLDYDPAVLSSASIEPDFLPAAFIATPAETSITASWHNPILLTKGLQAKNAHYRAFTLTFTALQIGKLSDVLHMSSAVTEAEAYTRQLETLGAALEFRVDKAKANKSVELLAVHPNPVNDRFTATYYLPEAGAVAFRLTDATGRVMQSVQTRNEKGYQQMEFELDHSVQTGLLFLHLEGPGGTDVQRVMVQK
ncbi:MAG: T9SS type A sorting domain-containing protein [Lewinellaceae bacterium]|nr:T9SS type A sorting domain-containing protein [Lewinellaceae bacterium]